jgi:hypothetical protein
VSSILTCDLTILGYPSSLFAARGIEAEFMDRLYVYMNIGLTALAISVLVWLILRIRSWFYDSDGSDEPLQEMLTQFHQLKREGELSDEEYRSISQRLSAGLAPSENSNTAPHANSKPAKPGSDASTNQ